MYMANPIIGEEYSNSLPKIDLGMFEEVVIMGKRKVIYLVMFALLSTGLYFCLKGNLIIAKEAKKDSFATLPLVENTVSNTEDGKSTKAQHVQLQSSIAPLSESVKMERPAPIQEKSVNLEGQSYSIRNEKKDIRITPGVSLQRGKSINVKIPGDEGIVRIQRDKEYHPGGYNVLLERKY